MPALEPEMRQDISGRR